MARYGMVLNLDRCIGCYNCQIACKDEHVGNDFPPMAKSQPAFGHFWMAIEEVERVISPSHIRANYIPVMCQQCQEAPENEPASRSQGARTLGRHHYIGLGPIMTPTPVVPPNWP